ncbi:MAG: Asp23/Gls24 family envelope stress response protein [Candidatus Dormibacteraceae bacterium]
MSEQVTKRDSVAGSIRIANEVIASIAGLAALEVEGVAGLDHPNASHFGDWLKRETVHQGVRVALDVERELHLEVFLTAKSTAMLNQVAAEVQVKVIEAVERMLDLRVSEVNVLVSSIDFAD